ncbi:MULTISPECIES: subtilase-type protease inhibitor [unclassified Streptomyces]|uniref:subtilase-type protease inhibitor n=1 Tax=unclassified Streptomyces TaxID=2593676 RepID=UPI0019042E0A|nr:subtilase-type protease inhibitor [Streptomyces sp. HSG2]
MRNTARWAIALGFAVTTALGPLAVNAGADTAAPEVGPAAPASLYTPSALVLTVAHGDSAASATPLRAVTLVCSPTPSGSHPAPEAACAELRRVEGDVHALTSEEGAVCAPDHAPVVVTVEGVWEGRRLTDERTFTNTCVKDASSESVFTF